MSDVMINRRQAVRAAAGVAAGGLLVTGAGVGSAAANSGSGLLGSWLVTHEDDSGSGLAVVSFIADGVVIANDIRPAAGVGTGAWEDKGDDKFKATIWFGNPADDTSAKAEVWGEVKDDKVSGTFEFTLYDSDGEEVDSIKGTFEGEPLDA